MEININYNESAGLIPDGEYIAYCKKCEDKLTAARNGKYLRCDFVIHSADEGKKDFEGRQVQTMFNYENPNMQAVAIGQKQLKSYCESIGEDIRNLKNTEQLEYKLCKITVATANDRDGDLQNVIKKFAHTGYDNIKVQSPADEFTSSSAADFDTSESPF